MFSAKKSIRQKATSVRVYYKELASLKADVVLDELAVPSETKVCILCPCFCFQLLFLVCSNGWVKLRHTKKNRLDLDDGTGSDGTQVTRLWFVLKINHRKRTGAGKCIFPPVPSSHYKVCHHQIFHRFLKGIKVKHSPVERIILQEAKLAWK